MLECGRALLASIGHCASPSLYPSMRGPDRTPDTPTQMKIFLSHNHKDVAYCHALVAALRGAGADVWYDEHVRHVT
jgi:predicted esterase